MHHILHLHKGKECKVFDCPYELKRTFGLGEVIAIDEVYYKIYDIQCRFAVRGGNNLMPIEIKISARDKDEDYLLYSHPYLSQQRTRAIDFFRSVHPLLNTGHSLESAYDKLYNE